VAVRELVYDANNQVVKAPSDPRRRRATSAVEPVASAAELKPGETRKETEGVFVLRNSKVEFVPIKVGISGDKYFEVTSGLKAGDQVVTGPYNSVRGMTDGDTVKVDTTKAR
jgi:HlyD family secretion protein